MKPEEPTELVKWANGVVNPKLLFCVEQMEALGLQSLLVCNHDTEKLPLLKDIAKACDKYTGSFKSKIANPTLEALKVSEEPKVADAIVLLEKEVPPLADLVVAAKLAMTTNALVLSRLTNLLLDGAKNYFDKDEILQIVHDIYNQVVHIETVRSSGDKRGANELLLKLISETGGWVNFEEIAEEVQGAQPEEKPIKPTIDELYTAGL